MPPTLAQLETFYWIVRLGTFRAAAHHMNLTQPTVSQRIRELESALGARLLERSGQRTRMTAEGSEMMTYAERILSLTEDMEKQVRTQRPLHRVLRLGAADTVALSGLPELLTRFERQHPEVQVELCVDYSTALARQLANRELDIAFLVNPEPVPHIAVQQLGQIELSWIASPRLRLSGKIHEPADLTPHRIITNPRPSNLLSTIEDWFSGRGERPERISTCDSLTIIARLVAAGFGISLLPTAFLSSELQSGTLRVLPTAPPITPLTLCTAYQRDRQDRGITTFIAMARDILARPDHVLPF